MRIIPVTIVTALLFLAVKMIDLTRGTEMLSAGVIIANVEAQQAGDTAAQKMPEKTEEQEVKTEEKSAEKPEEKKEEKSEEQKGEPAKSEETKSDIKESAEEKKEPENTAVSESSGDTTDRHFTSSELDLLQKLAARRDELDRWERNIQIKEEVLNATEKRINERILEIESMKKQVAELLAQYNEKEDAKIRSLVKIYENMKPKEAARIFDEIEMPILLLVIDKMAEKKAAPILAGMNSTKAKQITVELADQRKYNSSKMTSVAPAATPPASSPSQQ
ncbi:MAG: MotE family protein [Alphaproteobacteria bacterium]